MAQRTTTGTGGSQTTTTQGAVLEGKVDVGKLAEHIHNQSQMMKAILRLEDAWVVSFHFQPQDCELVNQHLEVHSPHGALSLRTDAIQQVQELGDQTFKIGLRATPFDLTIQPDHYPSRPERRNPER